MVLLTSSQVQVALSSAIIFSFTFLLFLAGYLSQQRSVEGLHAALRPRAPVPRHKTPDHGHAFQPLDPTNRLNRPLGRLRDRLKWQTQLVAADFPFDWSRLAYAQLVRDHSETCNAVIVFSELHRLKSSAPRLLLFPQHWVQEKDGQVADPYLETSRRLLKKASRRYRVTLVPIKPDVEGKGEDDPGAYSSATLAALDQYRKVMTFPTPGLVLDTGALDSILAFTETEAIAAYPPLNTSVASTILVTPSKKAQELLNRATSQDITSDSLVPDIQDQSLFSTSHALRVADATTFNATDFLASTAYMHFSDPDLPGPEYDIPYSSIVKMRPSGDDQSFLWEKMYSTYKDRRYGVCGLDLESWPPVSKIEASQQRQENVATEEDRADL
ncbi:uncharacterized protein PV09_06598 [Verruconis gallopava]|uniref:Glycosyltransferase family 8 protein n=1 Tax=Verruconis gallopava TaxID=253628 RepID=A0A0D2A5V5_9PEZI|nr:uncharacterized protein PV09_06598 [Verruconis gallopava]KIW02108.1 hypothetical protein PV09_06598 [Verruconis gallopava]